MFVFHKIIFLFIHFYLISSFSTKNQNRYPINDISIITNNNNNPQLHCSDAIYINHLKVPFPRSKIYHTSVNKLKNVDIINFTYRTPSSLFAIPIMSSSLAATAKTTARARYSLQNDPIIVLSSVFLLSLFGITLEGSTKIGKALSAPLATMAAALVMANLGIIPFSSPIYTSINQILVPLALPLLLFESNMRNILCSTRSLLLAFVVSCISTVFGTILSYMIIPLSSLGSDGWKVASALMARHIGGAINFVAVSDTLGIKGTHISAAIAADNIVVALYFTFLFSVAKPSLKNFKVIPTNKESDLLLVKENMIKTNKNVEENRKNITILSLSLCLTVSSFLVAVGKMITNRLLPKGTSSLSLASIITVFAVTLFPKFFSNLKSSGTTVGTLFMQMFFTASGACGSIPLVLQSAPILFVFSAFNIIIHYIMLMFIGKFVLRLQKRDLYLASNSNVGGPTTAAAMAQAKNWSDLVGPALMIGILGYTIGTPIGLGIGKILQMKILPNLSRYFMN